MKFKKININNLFGNLSTERSTYPCAKNEKGTDTCKKNTKKAKINADGRDERRFMEDQHGCSRSFAERAYSRYDSEMPRFSGTEMRDRGNEPIVFDIRKEAYKTPDFRTALWTGGNLQLTVMTVPVGEEVGIERHDGIDQLVGVVSGAGEVAFGNRENYFAPPVPLDAHSVILIPAGTYHNIKNVGRTPLKLYSVYAPKAHKFGAVDKFNVE